MQEGEQSGCGAGEQKGVPKGRVSSLHDPLAGQAAEASSLRSRGAGQLGCHRELDETR